MSTLLDISLLTLGALAVLQSIVLRAVMQETLRFRRIYTRPTEPESRTQPDVGRPSCPRLMPFRKGILDSTEVLTETELRTRLNALLFMEANIQVSGAWVSVIYSIWNRIDGCLYVMCKGSEVECRELRDRFRLDETYGSTAKVAIDENGELAVRLGIRTWPSAIIIDENGHITKVGLQKTLMREGE